MATGVPLPEAQHEVVDSNSATRSAIKLSELCESSFLLKRGKVKRKVKGLIDAPKPKGIEIIPKAAISLSETKYNEIFSVSYVYAFLISFLQLGWPTS